MKFNYIFFPLLLSVIVSKAASKIDTIYFQNGDRVTGEIKSLEKNLLRLSTDDAGIIKVEWANVDSVYVLNTMRITLGDGNIYYGKLFPSGNIKQCILIDQKNEKQVLNLNEIVMLSPLEKKITKRLRGTLSTGINYTKSSEIAIFNFSGNIAYIETKNIIEADYNHIRTIDKNRSRSQRQDGSVSLQRVFPDKWFLSGLIIAESNSEFQLDLRTTAAIGGGKNLVLTNSDRLYILAGTMVNREFADTLRRNNLEGIARFNYSRFIYDSPKITFNLVGDIIPSITLAGRFRSEIDSSLKWEILNDFYLKWTFYHSFDSNPLSKLAENSDWGISFGFEYKI
ncbi:DUF481 domain-containing protein [Bacteroidota bacterium]